jgi:hypothetical protein
MPTSTTAAPDLTMSRVSRPGRPAATTTMSALRVCDTRSLVPVWHNVTVAFSVRLVSSKPSERPTVMPRPMTVTSAPAIGTSYRRSRATIPRGVAGSGPGSPSTSLPRLTGCSPSTSLAGSIRPRTAPASSPSGSGSCTMYPVHAGSAFSSSITASTSAWVAVAGSSRRIELIPTWALSRCLPRTYAWLPGSSPTSTVPRPGTRPCSASRATRTVRSSRTSAAATLPSSICAAIG